MAATYRRLLGAALGAALLLAGCAGAPPPPAAGTRGPAAPGDPESPGGGPGAGPGRVLRRPLPLRGDHPRRGGLLRAHPGAVSAGRGAPAPHRGRPVPGRPPVERQELHFGDVVFFNRYCQTRGRGPILAGILSPGFEDEVCHNGIYLGGGRFMHASPRGVFISRLDAEVWRVSYRGARRYLPGGN